MTRLVAIGVASVLWMGAACSSSEADVVVTGLVTEIEAGAGFGNVVSFTVRAEGESHRIYVDPNATYDFPLAHLSAHRAGAEPVRVEAERRKDRLVATEIADG